MKTKDAFKLLNMFLVESSFQRELLLDFNGKKMKENLSIDVEKKIEENIIFVSLSVLFNISYRRKKYINAKIKMLGIFEFGDDIPISIDSFGEINGPAIIFPFIREHLANVSMKAGIEPILLPPINFVQLAKDRKNN